MTDCFYNFTYFHYDWIFWIDSTILIGCFSTQCDLNVIDWLMWLANHLDFLDLDWSIFIKQVIWLVGLYKVNNMIGLLYPIMLDVNWLLDLQWFDVNHLFP